MPDYDLITESWIPIVDLDGIPRDVGLREALAEAHAIREIYTDSPMEVAALNRLLLALAIRIFPETAEKQDWFARWKEGTFDAERIDAYFGKWRYRFDLLDTDRPFYQHPEPLVSGDSAISKLFTEEASGNNATLFSHEFDDQLREVPLERAARGIVATQAAAIGGGVSKPFNLSHAPLIAGAIFWLRGNSLFEALMLNAAPSEECRMGESRKGDRPAWESKELPTSAKREPLGYLDYLTWQSRRLLLVCREGVNGKQVGTALKISQGDKEASQILDDPLMTYRKSKEKGIYSYRMSSERALWRDSAAFFTTFSPENGGGPRTFEWVAFEEDRLGEHRWLVDVFGMATDQAKIELWRRERLPFYTAYLRDYDHRNALEAALDLARKQSLVLRGACETVAAFLLFPTKEGYQSLSQNEKREAGELVRALDAGDRYWSCLEIPFYELLREMAETDVENLEPLLDKWAKTLHRTALSAFDEATSTLDSSARHLRAVAEGRRRLRSTLSYNTTQTEIEQEVTT